MTYVVIGVLVTAAVVGYCALVVGGRADEQAEAWARNHGAMR